MGLQVNKERIRVLSQTIFQGLGHLPPDTYTPARVLDDVRQENLFGDSDISYSCDYQALLDRISDDFAYGELIPDMHLISFTAEDGWD